MLRRIRGRRDCNRPRRRHRRHVPARNEGKGPSLWRSGSVPGRSREDSRPLLQHPVLHRCLPGSGGGGRNSGTHASASRFFLWGGPRCRGHYTPLPRHPQNSSGCRPSPSLNMMDADRPRKPHGVPSCDDVLGGLRDQPAFIEDGGRMRIRNAWSGSGCIR